MNIGQVAKGYVGWCVAGAAALATLFAAEPAGAATVTVGSSCSLVNAVASVNALSNIGGCTRSGGGGERISIPAGNYNVSQELILTRSVRITASLPGATIVSSAGSGLSFSANSNPPPTLTIDNVTIKPNVGVVSYLLRDHLRREPHPQQRCDRRLWNGTGRRSK